MTLREEIGNKKERLPSITPFWENVGGENELSVDVK